MVRLIRALTIALWSFSVLTTSADFFSAWKAASALSHANASFATRDAPPGAGATVLRFAGAASAQRTVALPPGVHRVRLFVRRSSEAAAPALRLAVVRAANASALLRAVPSAAALGAGGALRAGEWRHVQVEVSVLEAGAALRVTLGALAGEVLWAAPAAGLLSGVALANLALRKGVVANAVADNPKVGVIAPSVLTDGEGTAATGRGTFYYASTTKGLTLTLDLGTVFDRANGLLFRVCGVRLILGQYTKLGKVLVEGSAAAAGDGGGGWAPLLQTSVQEATESGRYALRRFPCARARRVRLTLSQAVGDVYIVREVELPGHAGFCQLRCRHGGACLSEGSACACVPRWRWSGANCSDVDECASNNGGCGGGDEARARCTNTDGGFSCACRGGFGGDTKVCDDLDECYSANDCVTAGGSRCENTVGSYSCRCLPGYASAVSEQQVKRGERPSARCAAVCSFGACKNGGKCTAPDSCTGCLGGWSGPRCDQVDVKKQRQAVEDAATYCESPLVWDCSINFVPLVGCGCRARPVIFMVYASALFLALIVAATLLLFWRSCWRGRRARKLLQRVEAMEKEDEEEEAQAMRELQEEEDEEWDEHGFISGAGNATVANAEWMLNGYEEQDLEGRLSTVQFNSKDEEQEDPSDKEARRQRQALAKARKKAKAPKDLESRGAKWKPGSAMPQGKGKKFKGKVAAIEKKSKKRDKVSDELRALLARAVEEGLSSSAQARKMKENVRKGVYTSEYYEQRWRVRIEEAQAMGLMAGGDEDSFFDQTQSQYFQGEAEDDGFLPSPVQAERHAGPRGAIPATWDELTADAGDYEEGEEGSGIEAVPYGIVLSPHALRDRYVVEPASMRQPSMEHGSLVQHGGATTLSPAGGELSPLDNDVDTPTQEALDAIKAKYQNARKAPKAKRTIIDALPVEAVASTPQDDFEEELNEEF